ncbi:MAG TPA: YqiA/YcfP family alpha/beta fold hydrolase, partial [Burkholderiaceae bacterium]|nr:YqiA/YcfP family alpha/beta fold hydrolase [Burkholderiaceae bacterium]
MIVYLHGFRSSPASRKATMLRQAMASRGRSGEFLCPALPASPARAVEQVEALVRGVVPDRLALIGSSLGGYYATWLAERIGCRAVLLNPAIRPQDDLAKYLGVQPV